MRISDWISDVFSADLPFLGAQFGEPAIEDRFRGRDELENDRFACTEVVPDRRDHCRQLHAEKKLAEEALLGGREAGPRRDLGAAVERGLLELVDNGGALERPFHVADIGRASGRERGSQAVSISEVGGTIKKKTK